MCVLDNILVGAIRTLEDFWTKCTGNRATVLKAVKNETRLTVSVLCLFYESLSYNHFPSVDI
jgi:hypothetical protein